MKKTEIIMGMPISVEILGAKDAADAIRDIFDYFKKVDRRYSTYKPDSEISRINDGLPKAEWSAEMKRILEMCEQTKRETDGYFDVMHDGRRDPSGLVKGWAINEAAKRLRRRDIRDFCLEAGGDFQTGGRNSQGEPWKIGIRNPFDRNEIVKVVSVTSKGVATSGTAVRGQHIYDPYTPGASIDEVKSLTVIGPDIYEADRFATAAFAMGPKGIGFIDSLEGFEGYMIDANKNATLTSGFERYVV